MRANESVIIVVPCYNEEQRLPVDEFRTYAAAGASVEFLFVNDGSTDGTGRMLTALRDEDPARFHLLDLARNGGKAEAVRRGLLAALEKSPDFVGFWDADLATPLSEIPAFLEVFAGRPEIEMIFAARVRLLGRSISRNPARHYFGRVGATLISQSLGLAVYDTQCGAKLFRVSPALQELFEQPFLSRWLFDVEIIARFVLQRGRDAAARAIYELPIMVWHDVKGSKVKHTDFLRALRDLLRIRRAYRLGQARRDHRES
ncbi:MAG TPA: glycosyltransferase [Thermoanaerobaculia bacterium]|nr:glycosyltransferase [Thermoanaerobaculia bacterium]